MCRLNYYYIAADIHSTRSIITPPLGPTTTQLVSSDYSTSTAVGLLSGVLPALYERHGSREHRGTHLLSEVLSE